MGEQLSDGRIDRRELLKRGAVAGGIVWASPMVFSATAGAAVVGACTDCPDDRLFGLKYNNIEGDNSRTKTRNSFEEIPDRNNGQGNCLTASASLPPGCIEYGTYFSFTSNADGTVHTWTLQPGLEFCQAAAKVGDGTVDGEGCFSCGGANVPCDGTPDPEPRINVSSSGGVTTITITDPALSHSEILFCYKGSPLPCF